MRIACSLDLLNAGSNNAARIAITAITRFGLLR